MHAFTALIRTSGVRIFFLVWFGQFVSVVGSTLSQFALGIWIFLQTGSPTQFALTVLCTALPRIVLAPLAGELVDRRDQRWILIISDVGAALTTSGLLALAVSETLEIWHIYTAITITAVCGTFQRPAYLASISRLIPAAQYARASGMVAAVPALAAIIAPALAGVLVLRIGLAGIFVVDLVTFLVAVGLLMRVRFPVRAAHEPSETEDAGMQAAGDGWRWVMQHPGLLRLLLVLAAANCFGITAEVLLVPYLLSFSTTEQVGVLIAIGGVGLLAGSVLLAIWGGPRRLLWGIFGFEVIVCLATIGMAATGMPWLLAAIIGGYFAAISLADGCATAFWQRAVPPAYQGRIFALREAFAVAALPLGLAITAPLAEYVLEPRLQPDGMWAESIGALIGVGPGRGIALIFIIAGLVNLLILALGWRSAQIRQLARADRS